MRKLLNTLYVFTEDVYLALDDRNVVAKREGKEVGRVPLHTLESIQTFSYMGASPALMGACAEQGIALGFFDRRGRFLADIHGAQRGNVLLRKQQCQVSESDTESLAIARNCIIGKIFNCRWVLERSVRDHAARIDADRVRAVSAHLMDSLSAAKECELIDSLRGIEGDAAAEYFSVFDELILRDKETFYFRERVRRPPTDAVNAMLSFFYTVLARDCSSALEAVGLDPYIGFMHADRPGRRSLALDCMEELRPLMVDRFVVTAINNRVVNAGDFEKRETGEVLLTAGARKALFEQWQKRNKEQIKHPFVGEKIPWGLVPFIQAQLLAKYLRGDLDGYPPFMWK